MELFKQAFRGKESQLVNRIDIEHGLLIELKSRNVLTGQQKRAIESKVCITDYCLKYL